MEEIHHPDRRLSGTGIKSRLAINGTVARNRMVQEKPSASRSSKRSSPNRSVSCLVGLIFALYETVRFYKVLARTGGTNSQGSGPLHANYILITTVLRSSGPNLSQSILNGDSLTFAEKIISIKADGG